MPRQTPPVEVDILRVGGRADGIGEAEIGRSGARRRRAVFVPLTLPGERVVAQPLFDGADGVACDLAEIAVASPERIDPRCRHFGQCGGCALQHWHEDPYRDWKRQRVELALRRTGVAAGRIDGVVSAPPGARRRAAMVMRRLDRRVVIGFHERRGNRIVDIAECPVLDDRLAGLADGFREAAPEMIAPGETARITVNLLETGPDVLVALPGEPDRPVLEALSGLAATADFCRLSTASPGDAAAPPTPVVQRREPRIRFAEVAVRPPPGAFLQATAEGAAAIVAAVRDGVGSATRLLDLFAGCGTLTFPLAGCGRVHAVDSDPSAIEALQAAAHRAGLSGRVTSEVRDLRARPLTAGELADYDAVVFDPPRAGARAQAALLAGGGPDRIVAVSCNPDTFARDARMLADGGYRLERVVPVDQFLWSPHVELIAHFRREAGLG